MNERRIQTFLLVASALLLISHGFVPNYCFRPTLPVNAGSSATSSALHLSAANGETTSSAQTLNSRLNIFHEYDKPIILLGTSSENQELTRLANSLVSEKHYMHGGQVVSCADCSTLLSVEEIMAEHKWPDVLVLDFANHDHKADSTEMIKLTENLYQAEFLSIFVNVQPTSVLPASSLEEKVFVPFSDYELCIQDEGALDSSTSEWQHIEWELTRLLARARLLPAIPGDTSRSYNTAHLTMGQHTFFLSLSFPEISQAEPFVEEMCQDVDAMEYRTDLLDCRDSRFGLLYGMQQLRKYCRPHVVRSPALPAGSCVIEDNIPIVYTVRTEHQAGTYPDDEDGISRMFDMLRWGLRGGVEVLDVESAWDFVKTQNLLNLAQERYASQILGSHHVVGETVTLEEAVGLFQQCAFSGRAHGAKVVLSIEKDDDDRMAYEAALITSELARSDGAPVIPNISLVLGEVGQFSRIINLPFCPVTHESLPFKAAPGQLSASEIMATRLLTRIFEKKNYAILGHNIAYSVSPQMQGAGFAAVRLPHSYVRADVATVEEFVESEFFKSGSFGGCSVTIPHKQAIIPYVDELSAAAKAIGSVNTLVVKEEFVDDGYRRTIYGDNTDWRGIFNPLDRLLAGSVDSTRDYALIVGAGGTARAAAYVVGKLGLQAIYYNRTPEKADELQRTFGGIVVSSLDEDTSADTVSLRNVLPSATSLRVVISTLPASVGFTLPEWLLKGDGRCLPIIFDVNYKPFNTELLLQATTAGCNVVRGSEMLWEQGVGQFEMWTERGAPYKVMKNIVLENCKEGDS